MNLFKIVALVNSLENRYSNVVPEEAKEIEDKVLIVENISMEDNIIESDICSIKDSLDNPNKNMRELSITCSNTLNIGICYIKF
jgi:hypothetical protein